MSRARIDARFAAVARENRAAFAPYIVAGDPDAETAWAILAALPAAGADLIELGLPFSDPVADGPAIQRGAARALAAGMDTAGVLALVRRFRAVDRTTPVVLMGYYNPLLSFGLEVFAAAAAEAGIDGLIVVDAPPEESGPLADALEAHDLALVRLVTPTSDAARLTIIGARARGFLYFVSVTGVTGVKQVDAAAIAGKVARARAATGLPVAVGFGVKTPDQAAEVARIADAVVVGSAFVEAISASLAQGRAPAPDVLAAVAALSSAVRSARAGG